MQTRPNIFTMRTGADGQQRGRLTGMFAGLMAALIGAAAAAAAATPSFPGAAGFGATTPGGRGGPVVAVTSLADSGPGTLRWALEQLSGPRIVIFAVEGEIALRSQISARGRLTLLGQVAPGAGVVVVGARIRIVGDDAIVRGMRIRPGDGPGQDLSARDALTVGGRGAVARRVVIDSCSFAWATDENASVWGNVSDVTFSNNIVAEGLGRLNKHDGGMGLLISRGARRVSVHGNLFHSNRTRNPQVGRGDEVEIVNNLIVNPGIGGVEINTAPTRVDVLGNVLISGPDTRGAPHRPLIALQVRDPGFRVFLSDNITSLGPNVARGPSADVIEPARVVPGSGLPVLPAAVVRERVLARAGARWPTPDPVDARILAEAAAGRGKLINTPSEAGDPPARPSGAPLAPDRDGDGIPDDAERAIGSNPDIADSHMITPGSPYAFIEIYAESLRAPR